MGQIAKSLGTPVPFEFDGQTYQVSPWTFGILGQFEVYLEEQALINLKRMKPFLTDDEFKDLAHKTKQDLDKGKYTFGNNDTKDVLNSNKHLKVLAHLCLQAANPSLPQGLMNRLEQDREKFEELIAKMFEANSDPNVEEPKTSTTT